MSLVHKTSSLEEALEPLSRFYNDKSCVELRMVKPGEVILEKRGYGKERKTVKELDENRLEFICKTLANSSGLTFSADSKPKLSCILPEGKHRFEALIGDSVRTGLSLAIRCKHPFEPTWEQIGADETVVKYLKNAIDTSKNIIISGATNTGKTTLLNKMLTFLPDDRRVVAAEDTPELHIDRFWDGVGLIAEREEVKGSAMVDWRQLYDHCMRITPDHILFGEISTQNSFGALAALNSGITGFMCTIHAESAKQAITRKFEQNIQWSGQNMSNVAEYMGELVDVVIQIKRTNTGYRQITEIFEPRNDRYFYQKELGDS